MSRVLRRGALVAALTVATACAAAASASAFTLPFTNYSVSGSMTLAKLGETITLPAGSTFNGSATFPTVGVLTGTLTGTVSIPAFTAPLTVLGIPATATLQFVETQPASGTIAISGANVTIAGSDHELIKITKLSSPLLPINLVGDHCQTSSPVVLPLDYSGPLNVTTGIPFTGEATLPLLTGCGLLTPALDLLMAGPNNPFSITLKAPAQSS